MEERTGFGTDPFARASQVLTLNIHRRDLHLVHRARRFGTARLSHDSRRHACDRRVAGHWLEHDRTGRDARAIAHGNVSEHLRAGADQHTVADLGMAVARLLTGAA